MKVLIINACHTLSRSSLRELQQLSLDRTPRL